MNAVLTNSPENQVHEVNSANELSMKDSSEFRLNNTIIIQPKLSVGAVDDPFEREADAMADRVMRMPETSFIQRKCAACEHEEEKIHRKITPFIQKQSIGSEGGQASESVSNQIENSRGGGSRMSENTLSFMESRFGADFSDVKIHTDSNAVQMSRELNAQAFTVGSDIYFNSGKYAPDSDSGKHLLAHELTHTVQQGGGVERKVQRTGDTGTSVYEERVSSTSTSSGSPGVTRGTIERTEYTDASHSSQIHQANVNVIFDANNCTITIPKKVKFENHSTTTTTCGDVSGAVADPVSPVSAAAFEENKNNFLRANNEGLNGWFRLRLTNAPNHPCNDRNMAIVVQATEVTSDPDVTVVITANRGRSYVSGDDTRCVLCNNPSYDVMVHESGHMTLGHGDEYSERSRRSAASERLTDSSRMAQVGPERLQVFHERHFAFVPEFIRHIIPGCTASLIYGDRPRFTPIFYSNFGMGYLGGGLSGLYYTAGLDMGIPLDTLRRTQILIGPHVSGLLDVSNERIMALLYGVRLGMMGTFTPTIFNQQLPIGVGLHTELGRGHTFSSRGGVNPFPTDFTYMELGGSLNLRLPGSGIPNFGLDTGIGALDLNSPTTIPYIRLGLIVGGEF
jgi:Domain of unknown function (DUF4157)